MTTGLHRVQPAVPAGAESALRAFAERLAAAGTDARWDDLLPGHRRCCVEEPCGHRLELLARIRS